MSEGNYDTKIEFYAEREFAVIRDTFNFYGRKIKSYGKREKRI